MLWVGFVVLGNIFVFEISEKKWWVLSKEEERRRGNGLKEEGKGRGRGRENVGERKTSEAKKRETKNERAKWWEDEKNKWEV